MFNNSTFIQSGIKTSLFISVALFLVTLSNTAKSQDIPPVPSYIRVNPPLNDNKPSFHIRRNNPRRVISDESSIEWEKNTNSFPNRELSILRNSSQRWNRKFKLNNLEFSKNELSNLRPNKYLIVPNLF